MLKNKIYNAPIITLMSVTVHADSSPDLYKHTTFDHVSKTSSSPKAQAMKIALM